MGPQLALGDGALGFWKALRQVYPGAREQRCWVHKTGNVLNKLPKGLQKKAKGRLQDIWMAETRKDAELGREIARDEVDRLAGRRGDDALVGQRRDAADQYGVALCLGRAQRSGQLFL